MGAQFGKMRIPVCERLVTLFPAWSASTNTFICTGVPLGVGVKFALGKKATINLEYGIRKTFTDYLDDVGSNTYVDAATLAAENGPLAAALTNRSLDGFRYGKRGNSATSDWYSFYGAVVTFRLGKPNRCTMP